MAKSTIDAIKKRYIALFVALLLIFVAVMLLTNVSGSMFANILATLIMLAMIPYAIILLIRRKKER